MELKDLQSMGAIVSRKLTKRVVPIKRPVMRPADEWADAEIPEFTDELVDDTVTVHIRRGTSADAIEIMQATERERPFVAIYRSICNDKGEPVFPTLDDAMQLALWLVLPLFNAVTEVAGQSPKASRRRTSSGAKSRSPSAVAASASGSTP